MPLFDLSRIDHRSRPILFLDFEMTGLDVSRHEIIEIAALVVRQPEFKAVKSYYTKVHPVHIKTAEPDSLEILGYRPQDWTDAIPLHRALVELSALAPNCMLAGWGGQNEWDFLTAALQRENLPFFYDHHLIEVWTLAYTRLYGEDDIDFFNLPKVAKKLGIHLEKHKPDSDIRATFQIFKKLTGL